MKSYLAKLAARATIANAPVLKTVNAPSAPDPFEATVTSSEVTPRVAVSSPFRLPVETSAKRRDLSKSEPSTIEPRTPAEQTLTQARTTSPPSAALTGAQQSTTETTSVSQLPPAPQDSAIQRKARVDAEELTSISTNRSDQPLLEAQGSQLQIPASRSKDHEDLKSADEHVDERLSNIENEQSVLLRKADAFMAGMLDRRHRSSDETKSDREEDDHHRHPTPPETFVQPATRLQPPSALPRVAELADEEPSLVIGKLSVEVVPTPAPAVTPQPQVVVIGGGRRTRAGVPSAHRFGFSRY